MAFYNFVRPHSSLHGCTAARLHASDGARARGDVLAAGAAAAVRSPQPAAGLGSSTPSLILSRLKPRERAGASGGPENPRTVRLGAWIPHRGDGFSTTGSRGFSSTMAARFSWRATTPDMKPSACSRRGMLTYGARRATAGFPCRGRGAAFRVGGPATKELATSHASPSRSAFGTRCPPRRTSVSPARRPQR